MNKQILYDENQLSAILKDVEKRFADDGHETVLLIRHKESGRIQMSNRIASTKDLFNVLATALEAIATGQTKKNPNSN